MKWYLTKIVFQIICGEGNHTPQFDEQLRIIEASSETEAYLKACSIGKNAQDCFENDQHKLVQWNFVNVSELYEINDFLDGAEIHSWVQETANAEGYTAFIHKKAENLRQGVYSVQTITH